MDRVMVYPGAIPLDSDMLNTNRNIQDVIGALAAATIGVNSGALWVDGFTLTQSAVANMQVTVGAGAIFSLQNRDNTAYGSLASDTSNTIVKIGQNFAPTVLTLTAPGTVGWSQNYLIEASFSETDTGSTVLSYYNASNPTLPYSGPGGAGTSNNTVRQQRALITLKAGTAAATGSQTTPAVDAGNVALYVLTIANGQTQIFQAQCNTASVGNIPQIPVKITQMRRRLSANVVVYVTTTGNDNNDGLTINTPFQTPQRAYNYLANSVDFNGFSATIALGPGTYNSGIAINGTPVGISSGNGLTIQGYTSNAFTTTVTTSTVGGASNPTISTTNANGIAIWGFDGPVTVAGMALATATSGNSLGATSGTQMTLGVGMTFGACAGWQMVVNLGGQIYIPVAYTISGGAQAHLNAYENGWVVYASSPTVTVSGTPAFSVAFAQALQGGGITAASVTYSGSATGTRALVNRLGLIDTGTGVAITASSYFPGNAFGVANTTGGIYA